MLQGHAEAAQEIAELSRLLDLFKPDAAERHRAAAMMRVADKLSAKDLALCTAFGVNPIAFLLERGRQAQEERLERWRREEREKSDNATREALARHEAAERERMRGFLGRS